VQEELTIEGLAGALGEGDATETETTGRGKLRRLRAALKWLDHQFMYGHTDLCCFIFAVSIVGSLAGAAYGSLAIWNHNGRVQAVERAKKMDGEVFTIKGVSSNLVGDTRLFLQNSRGEDCGWVMIYMSNPLNEEVNPLFLLFARKRAQFPMKVRTHYRAQPHALRDGKTVERFTGSFLDFEKLDSDPS